MKMSESGVKSRSFRSIFPQNINIAYAGIVSGQDSWSNKGHLVVLKTLLPVAGFWQTSIVGLTFSRI